MSTLSLNKISDPQIRYEAKKERLKYLLDTPLSDLVKKADPESAIKVELALDLLASDELLVAVSHPIEYVVSYGNCLDGLWFGDSGLIRSEEDLKKTGFFLILISESLFMQESRINTEIRQLKKDLEESYDPGYNYGWMSKNKD